MVGDDCELSQIMHINQIVRKIKMETFSPVLVPVLDDDIVIETPVALPEDQLASGFHWSDQPPVFVMNEERTKIISYSVPTVRFISNEANYLSYIIRWSADSHGCVLCGSMTVATKFNRYDNFVSHMVFKHPHQACYKHIKKLNPSYIDKISNAFVNNAQGITVLSPLASNGADISSGPKRSSAQVTISAAFSQTLQLPLVRILINGLLLGCLPLALLDNPGIHYIVTKLFNKPLPYGVSRRTISRTIKAEYNEEKSKRGARMLTFINEPLFQNYVPPSDNDANITERFLSAAHDAWKSRADHSYLGYDVRAMNVGVTPWKIESDRIACRLFPHPHTSQNSLALCNQIHDEMGIPFDRLSMVVQDTAAASLGTFDTVPIVGQLRCVGHVSQTFLKKAVKLCPILQGCFDSMHRVSVKLCGSSKRRQSLREALNENGLPDLKPVLDGTTRFGCKEAMANRAILLLPAARSINPEDMAGREYDEDNWNSDLDNMERCKDLVQEILPLFTVTSQWVQVMSSQTTVTMSLVRLMLTRFDTEIKILRTRAVFLQNERELSKKKLGAELELVFDAITGAYNEYFSDEFFEYYAYVIAEFLDPRTFSLVDREGIALFTECVQPLLLPSETEVHRPPILESSRRRGARVEAPAGTGADAAAEHLRAHQTLSTFETQLNAYFTVMSRMTKEQLWAYDPLVFWPRHAHMFPIFGRLARRFLAPAPTSCNVEEFFSVLGRICSPSRSRLAPDLLEALACLNGWKRQELNYSDSRASKRTKTAERFATLSLSMEILAGEADDEELQLQENFSEDIAVDIIGDEENAVRPASV